MLLVVQQLSTTKRKNMNKHLKHIAAAGLVTALLATGCKKDYENPNAATADQVYSSPKGLMGVSIGLQRLYTLGQGSTVYGLNTATGFVTNEVSLRNAGNIPELQFSTGGSAVDPTNNVLANIWSNANKIIYDANLVQASARGLGDRGYASGLIAYTTVMEALALGSLSMYWERVPDTTGSNVSFSPRVNGFRRAVAAIDAALAAVAANPISAGFNADMPAGHNLVNTLQALKARYALFAGDYNVALAAANAVDLTQRGMFNFDAANANPIFAAVTSTNNVYQPVDSTLGLPASIAPDLADRRVQFYTTINTAVAPRFRLTAFYNTATSAIPIYYPGEVTLIKAECLARNNDLANAVVELNKVVTKTAAADPLGIGAQLPPVNPTTQADVLEQIYRNRCIELYQSGLKLEDMRRFGRPVAERKRNFFPYPFRERDGNPNTPADPAF